MSQYGWVLKYYDILKNKQVWNAMNFLIPFIIDIAEAESE